MLGDASSGYDSRTGTRRQLFDTVVPLIAFSTSRATLTQRYAGLEVPPDDTKDARLKEPHVVGVIGYASAERVIREALVTCDDPEQAQELRSFDDESREMSFAARRVLFMRVWQLRKRTRRVM